MPSWALIPLISTASLSANCTAPSPPLSRRVYSTLDSGCLHSVTRHVWAVGHGLAAYGVAYGVDNTVQTVVRSML